MFRAAIHNSEALRSALDAQVAQVDQAALDAAVENMVEELLQQQAAAKEGGPEDENGNACPVASEEQLLALLAGVSRAPAASASSQAAASALPTSTNEQPFASSFLVGEPAPPSSTAIFASSTGLQLRPLPPSTRRRLMFSSPPRGVDALPTDSSDHVRVVSVGTLQHAAVTGTGRGTPTGAPSTAESRGTPFASLIPLGHAPSQRDAKPVLSLSPFAVLSPADSAQPPATSPPLSTSNADAPTISFHPSSKPATDGVSSVAAAPTRMQRRPARKVNLYSLLPLSSVSSNGDPNGGGGGGEIARGSRSHSITFAEMDRRPGIGTGPLAQQSVDSARLHTVSDSIFSSMDVLMDGNSCCVRRRRRVPGAGPLRGPSSTTACSLNNATPCTLTSSTPPMSRTVPLSAPIPRPPPRTAAEAKTRRIVDAQRRRQQQRASAILDATAAAESAGPTVATTNASKQSSSVSSFPSRGLAVTAIGNAEGRSISLPPLSTIRDVSSKSLLAHAVSSVHCYNKTFR
ncbi:hypothetical protein ABB37_05645 [Leptomonas pyrrhocoris]|uniref:Uncharacterized protein n=1 Tax=Leptomonas pyrrhocoris TaxID=157538 RepID=A0A0M9FZM1_LEPPY|nr:hypothetical protein ABB37_05645 [Leptomonas pyrrhocoris]KPA79136.1 hypothetical protein ABB37_05645 [Leptomonas pyrrhocoris]|eukprot:XP_015657575.1 hypothetical protein ABB37_05645 [Leptomonas pyrrhocoris]